MGGIGYWYYGNSQETIQILTENNAQLKTASQISEQTIASLQNDYEYASRELESLNADLSVTRERNRLLIEKLQEHELGYLASERPGLVENIINNASDNAARCFEILSGSSLTEAEKNARNANEFNSECPWLWKDEK